MPAGLRNKHGYDCSKSPALADLFQQQRNEIINRLDFSKHDYMRDENRPHWMTTTDHLLVYLTMTFPRASGTNIFRTEQKYSF